MRCCETTLEPLCFADDLSTTIDVADASRKTRFTWCLGHLGRLRFLVAEAKILGRVRGRAWSMEPEERLKIDTRVHPAGSKTLHADPGPKVETVGSSSTTRMYV